MALDKLDGCGLGGVELRDADDVDTGGIQFFPIQGPDGGQLPPTVRSPGREKRQERRRTEAILQRKLRPVERRRVERYRGLPVLGGCLGRRGPGRVGGLGSRSVRWKRSVGGWGGSGSGCRRWRDRGIRGGQERLDGGAIVAGRRFAGRLVAPERCRAQGQRDGNEHKALQEMTARWFCDHGRNGHPVVHGLSTVAHFFAVRDGSSPESRADAAA